MLNKKVRLSLAIIAALGNHSVMAAGFQLTEHSALGLGRAAAGEAAIADSAAVLANNPAGIAIFSSTQLTVSAAYALPSVNVTGDGPSDAFNNQLTANDIIPDMVIPSLYFSAPLGHDFSFGFAVFSDFGLMTEFPDDYLAGPIGGKTDLQTININPSIAYRINDHLSIGAGVSAVYGTATLVRNVGILGEVLGVPYETEAARLEGDGWGWGYNLGILWEINNNHRLGLSYRSDVDVEFEGKFNSDLLDAPSLYSELTLNLPSIAEFSGYHRIFKPFAIHYSVMMTGWDVFEDLSGTVDDEVVLYKAENFEDTLRYGLGATYYVNDKLQLRVGIAFDENASTQSPSISIPDSDRMNYSFGASYAFTKSSQLDFGFTYLDGDENTFEESLNEDIPDFAFKSDADAIVVALQYNHSF